ncbi:exostosin family protein [Dictyocaulus viviparus]|uniref:Exostosin family protein n=1 Tax=Dictyocaulus viviparus TaxID=29172 RepID=A0A0D8Y285_DICVI|nr:exostosin family protein [Dictyocaulus viviparus]
MSNLSSVPNDCKRKHNSFLTRTFILKKLLLLFSLKNVIFVAFLSIYTIFVLLLQGGFPCEESKFRHESRSVVIRDIDEIRCDDCNSHSMKYRIEELARILRSVRSELIDSSTKLRETNLVYEELEKKIPEKQLELNSLLDEIESARRTLRELQDRRNVRVFLPHNILYPDPKEGNNTFDVSYNTSFSSLSLEHSINYSQCSITSFMPLFVTTFSKSTVQMKEFKKEILLQGNVVVDPQLACLTVILTNEPLDVSHLSSNNGRNHVVINFGEPFHIWNSPVIMVQQSNPLFIRSTDYNLFLDVPDSSDFSWKQLSSLLPFSRTYLMLIIVTAESEDIIPFLSNDLSRLNQSALSTGDKVQFLNCSGIFNTDSCLSQKGNLDWRLASVRIALARFPELHFILRSFDMPEVLEMRRMGRVFFEHYLSDRSVVIRALLASLRERLGIILPAQDVVNATPLFNGSFTAPILTPVNVQAVDDEYLGTDFCHTNEVCFYSIHTGIGILLVYLVNHLNLFRFLWIPLPNLNSLLIPT